MHNLFFVLFHCTFNIHINNFFCEAIYLQLREWHCVETYRLGMRVEVLRSGDTEDHKPGIRHRSQACHWRSHIYKLLVLSQRNAVLQIDNSVLGVWPRTKKKNLAYIKCSIGKFRRKTKGQKYFSKNAKLTPNPFLEGERRISNKLPLRNLQDFDELTYPTPADRNHRL